MGTEIRQRCARIAATAIVLFATSAKAAFATASSGCRAANAGALNAEVGAATSMTRRLTLDAGDTLDVSAHSSSAASATLISGAGAPQTLINSASSAAVTFKATKSGEYALALAAAPQGSASFRMSCASAETAAANAAFLARRKGLLNAKDPNRIRIDRAPTPIANPDKPLASSVAVDDQGNPKQVEFSVALSEITAAAHPGQKPEPALVDLWLEARMENYAAGAEQSGNLGVVYLGTRTRLGSDILVGGLAQFDRGIEGTGYKDTRMVATGWMAGPYMSMRLGSGVVFDGRAAWGETDNIVPSYDAAQGAAERQLVKAKLSGTREIEGWRVVPSLGLVYLEDAVRDAESGETKAAGNGRIELLPEVSRRFEVNDDAYIEPRAAVGGFVGFDDFSALEPMVTSGRATDLHLKAEAGVAVGVKNGSQLQATGGVESTGTAAPESWNGRLRLNVPLGE